MSILSALRASSRPAASHRPQQKTRAILVDGQMRTIAQIRHDYLNGTFGVKSSNLGIITGSYTPEEVARAYVTGLTTFVGINVRCGTSAEILVHTVDPRGNVIEDSPAAIFCQNSPKHIWRLLAHQLIFGALYIRKRRNPNGYPSGLQILSPLDVEPEIDYATETVRRYRYTRGSRMELIEPRDMIVDTTFNPFSDIDGTSAVEVAKVRSDIETNIGRYGASFFANSARPDVVVTTEADLDKPEIDEAEARWKANFKGVLNAFRVFFAGGGKWTVTPITSDPKDLAMVELTEQADMKVLAVLRVNPILAGYGSAADALSAQGTYESVRRQHIEFIAIPDVRHLCNVLNEQWLHKDFAGSPWGELSLEPDTAAILSSAMGTGERITAATNAVGRIMSLNEAREYIGKPALKNVVQFNPDWALALWQAAGIKRSQLQLAVGFAPDLAADGYIYDLDPRAKGVPANTPSPFGAFPSPIQNASISTPEPPRQIEAPKRAKVIDIVPVRQMADTCYVLLSLANDPQLGALQAELRGQYPDVEWSTPDTLHITLVYATSAVNIEMVKQVLPQSINPFEFRAGPAGTFENTFDPADKRPFVLWVDAPLPLIALQSGLAGAFRALGLELSEYSVPENWRPHITLGYYAADAPTPEWDDGQMILSSSTLTASIEGNGQFETIYVTRSKEKLAAQLTELDNWRKRVKSRGPAARFIAEHLPADVANWIAARLADNPDDTATMFARAKDWIRTGTLAGWDESEHPRDPSGKFGDKPGGDVPKAPKPDKKPGEKKPKQPKKPAVTEGDPFWSDASRPNLPDDDGTMDYGFIDDSFDHASTTGLSSVQTKSLNIEQKKALTNYTGMGLYKDVNNYYRGKTANLSAEAAATAKQLDGAIAQSKMVQGAYVYRGLRLTPERAAQMMPGATINDKGYASTSFGQNIAQSYLDKGGTPGVMLRIKVPRGANALAVETASDWPDEKEVLLPRNANVKVTKVSKGKNGRLFVDAEYVQ